MPPRVPTPSPAGWYDDPYLRGSQRYFDGSRWSEDTRLPPAEAEFKAEINAAAAALAAAPSGRLPVDLISPEGTFLPTPIDRPTIVWRRMRWVVIATALIVAGVVRLAPALALDRTTLAIFFALLILTGVTRVGYLIARIRSGQRTGVMPWWLR